MFGAAVSVAGEAVTQSVAPVVPSATSDPMVFHQSKGLTIRGHIRAGANAIAETNLFWDLANRATGNSVFNPDTQWFELFVEPGLSFERRYDSRSAFYGKLSVVSSYTAGRDAFDQGDVGRTTLEDAYLGYFTPLAGEWRMDATLGSMPLRLGAGMLVANGGQDGFERGALKFGPREAWENSALLRFTTQSTKLSFFYLDANEMESNNTSTRLAGVDWRWDSDDLGYAGLSYIRAVNSDAPYPKAAPQGIGAPSVINGAREGLNTVNFYGRTNDLNWAGGDWAFFLDMAYQWDDEVDLSAWGGAGKGLLHLCRCALAACADLFLSSVFGR